MKKLAIVCGSRSGSTYLCKLINKTNRCGKPQEFFNLSMIFSYKKSLGLETVCPDSEYINKLINRYSTNNNVFSIKIVGLDQWAYYEHSGLKISHWVYLYREDSIAQAISRYVAVSTNGWHKDNGLPPYSYEGIKWCHDEVKKENDFFVNYFHDKPHIKLSYERDLCASPYQAVTSILYHMNIDVEDIPALLPESYNPHSIKQLWEKQFIEDEKTRT